MHALTAASFTSLQATLAPYFARASAIPLPMLGPTPVTRATLPSSEISTVNAPFLTVRTGPVGPCRLSGGLRGLTSELTRVTDEAQRWRGVFCPARTSGTGFT